MCMVNVTETYAHTRICHGRRFRTNRFNKIIVIIKTKQCKIDSFLWGYSIVKCINVLQAVVDRYLKKGWPFKLTF